MSARPCFRLLVRERQRFSGAVRLWIIDHDGRAHRIRSLRRGLGGEIFVRVAGLLP